MKKRILILMVATLLMVGSIQARTIEITLGDIDNFNYGGSGSVDDVYVDPDWESYWETGFDLTINDFDVIESSQNILATFLFDIYPNEEIVSAILEFGLIGISENQNGGLFIDPTFRPEFSELGWSPISNSERQIEVLDLSNVLNSNIIPHLMDGQINVAIFRDIGVDYLKLNLEIIPEPASILLLGLGCYFIKSKNHSH